MNQLALAVQAEPLLALTYRGNPAVKKNSQKLIPLRDRATGKTRTIIVPGDQYARAERQAKAEIEAWLMWQRPAFPLPIGAEDSPLHVRALFYVGKRQIPDLDGLMAGCADILEAAGIVGNDYWICSWDGTRRLRDPVDPRTEITIWRFDG